MMKVKRGDVVYLKKTFPMRDHIQGGNRPFLVVSNDTGNFYSEICIVVPMTTKNRNRLLPTHAIVDYNNSLCLCEQIFTISQDDVSAIKYHLSDSDMLKINRCLRNSLFV